MNALKHAFPVQMEGRCIRVSYEVDGANWKLSVADNGVGKPDGGFRPGEDRARQRASSRRSPSSSTRWSKRLRIAMVPA